MITFIEQVYGEEEWSFGFCEDGSGVFSCPNGKNPMYTYRENIVLGQTGLSISEVNRILRELSREWQGNRYDLLSRNCNHFCDAFCERLGVPKLPGNIYFLIFFVRVSFAQFLNSGGLDLGTCRFFLGFLISLSFLGVIILSPIV